MHFPNLPVSVHVTRKDGDKLVEYKKKVEGDSTTCYIESRAGEEWKIELGWKKGPGQRGEYDYQGNIHVDGRRVERIRLSRNRESVTREGVRSKDFKFIQPFMFQTLKVGDSDDEEVYRLNKARAEGLGSIIVKLERGIQSPIGKGQPQKSPHPEIVEPVRVHEKTKKRISEVTALGPARDFISRPRTVEFTPSDPVRILTFKFLYRCAPLLELGGIEVIPRLANHPSRPPTPQVVKKHTTPKPSFSPTFRRSPTLRDERQSTPTSQDDRNAPRDPTPRDSILTKTRPISLGGLSRSSNASKRLPGNDIVGPSRQIRHLELPPRRRIVFEPVKAEAEFNRREDEIERDEKKGKREHEGGIRVSDWKRVKVDVMKGFFRS